MQAYTGFAQVYDIFMDNVPYEEWAGYLTDLLAENSVTEGLILELGCGTGNITRRLAEKGYEMIGIDNSEEMLEIARDREIEITLEDEDIERILYLQQDMRSFELYGTVAAVVSICDSINYITSEQDLLEVFKLVNNYLDTNGIFIFDMNTVYKYKNILADNTIAENREDCSFIWENFYDQDKMINEYDVTIFVKLKEDDLDEEMSEEEMPEGAMIDDYEIDDLVTYQNSYTQLFERFQETHYQKAYSIETIKRLLEKAGLEFVNVFDAFTHNSPTDKSERVYFIARESHQDNKKYI